MGMAAELLDEGKRGHRTGDDYLLRTYHFPTTKDFLFVAVRKSDYTIVEVTASPSTLTGDTARLDTAERIEALRGVLGITAAISTSITKSGNAIIIRPRGLAFTATKLPAERLTWLGHASFQINAGDKNIYMDPYAGEYKDKADVILVSHSHSDHCDVSKIESIRKSDTVVIAPTAAVSRIGGNVRSLNPGEKILVGDIAVEAVEAYNYKRFRSPGNPYHPKGLGVGYVLTVGNKPIYHAGDTDFIPEMKDLKNIYLALLPTGGTYTMDNQEAAEAALAIKPKFVISMHRWDTDPNEFKKEVEAKSEIKVILPNPGEQLQLEIADLIPCLMT